MKSRNKDHKPHESIIGKIIYGFLLFMPLLAIGVTCAYAIFNKNAYQSYAGETLNQSDYEHISVNDMEVGKEYFLITPNSKTYQQQSSNTQFVVSNVTINDTLKDVNQIRFYVNTNSTTLTIQGIGNDSFIYQNNQTNILKFTFNGSNNNNYVNEINTILYEKTYVLSSFVSEVFYYSIDKVQQSPLFNWAEDSLIYTGMTNTCNALNITTPFIPLLMTYWLIISVIYILYDIILVILHIFHNKIHQLEDSF